MFAILTLGLGLPDFRLGERGVTPRACTFPPSRRLPRTQDRLQAVPCRGSEALRHAPFPHINRRAWNAEPWDWELVQREDGHGISASLLRNDRVRHRPEQSFPTSIVNARDWQSASSIGCEPTSPGFTARGTSSA